VNRLTSKLDGHGIALLLAVNSAINMASAR